MDLSAEQAVADAVGAATLVTPVGSGTHDEVGGPRSDGTVVRAPAGVVAYDPADLTITVGAGTTVAELARVLTASGQECPLDPRDEAATVGGTIATGLSGTRRLRYGPLRDRVLEVRFATADGRLVRGGGPTVKNVTGYDIPRLLVGSLGTLGVLTRVILRCQPVPRAAVWLASDDDPDAIRARCARPSSLLWDGATTRVLLEGHEDDLAATARSAGLEPAAPVSLPAGPHRGRISVRPAAVGGVGERLARVDGVRWLAEVGVGTVHVAADDPAALTRARQVAAELDGWMLREAGAPGIDGFGRVVPNQAVMARVKAAFDPDGKLAPTRLPIPLPTAVGVA